MALHKRTRPDVARQAIAGAVGQRQGLRFVLESHYGRNRPEDLFANLYSLLQTCAANGVDGYRYLRALLVELPKAETVEDFENLLLWRLDTADR